ncbi:MFS transporter [Oceanobacillus massiliensis]|uniref:MFS transporter n=1 Tax=Oceanobacillus massiliensis TaxID=1465765 RepID=UPI0030182065
MIIPYLFFATFSLIVVFRLKDVEGESVPVQLSDIGRLFKNKPFLIFMGLVMFIMVGHRVNDSYMGLYIAELGGTEGLIGIAWFAGVAAEALVFGFANFWFKKYHSLIFMIAAGLVYALRWFLYSWMDSPYGIVGLQILHGVSFGVFYSAAFQYVTGLIPRSMQSTGHLLFFAGFFGITGIIGSLGGGMIMDAFGGETLYFIMGIIAVTGTVLLTIYHILPYGKEIGSTITMPRIRIRRRA